MRLSAYYSPEGRVLWTRQFGSAVSDYAGGVAPGPDGSFYVTGSTYGALDGSGRTLSNGEAFLRKYSASGKVLWTRQFTCDTYNSSGFTFGHDVAVGQDGTIYIAGGGVAEHFCKLITRAGSKGGEPSMVRSRAKRLRASRSTPRATST